MADVLSQSEIDALLQGLSSGEMDAEELKQEESERKVRDYDFKRALRFSKDQIRSLSRIFENYTRLLTTYFSAQLRTFVQISVVSVEQLSYDEFIRSIPKKTILNMFLASPLEGRMVMEVNPNIGYAMLDRLLGGQGESSINIENLTEIEATVMERIFREALDRLDGAFESIVDLDVELQMLEVNPQFMQIVSPNETVAVVSINMKIGEVSGMINFCLPHVVLEPIMPKLNAHHWLSAQKKSKDKAETKEIQRRIKQAKIPMCVEVGHSQIHIQEFLGLAIGDVIRLDRTVDDPVLVKVGGKLKLYGQPGVYRGKSAVQITEHVTREEDKDE